MNNEIILKDKTFAVNNSSQSLRSKPYKKVCTCPICNTSIDVPEQSFNAQYTYEGVIADVTYKCVSCDKYFHISYYKGTDESIFMPVSVFPSFRGRNFSDEINNVSPRFVKLYNQAAKAEYDGNYELAGSGYRNALEILIKDYAITILNVNKNDVVSRKFNGVRKAYLKNIDLSNCADVVRILGNDNTHYERNYEDVDFSVLKQYLNMFIDKIDIEIKIKTPPVRDNQS